MINYMTNQRTIGVLLLLLLHAPFIWAAGEAELRIAEDAPIPVEKDRVLTPDVEKSMVPVVPSVAGWGELGSSLNVWDVPSISRPYSLRGRTIIPYLGAGFNGGFRSEFDRSIGPPPPTQTEPGVQSQFGQAYAPNEFQMGLRIPF